MYNVPNYAWEKDLFKVKDRLVDFKVLSNKISLKRFQIYRTTNFKESIIFSSFVIASKNNIHNYLKMLLKYFPLFQLQLTFNAEDRGTNPVQSKICI